MITYDFENSCIRVDGEIAFSRGSNAEFFILDEYSQKTASDEPSIDYDREDGRGDLAEFISHDRVCGITTILRAYPVTNLLIDPSLFIDFYFLYQVTATEFELKPCD